MMKETSGLRFGAEVYTWFMHNEGETYKNRLDHLIKVTAAAGFAGIEPIHFWMGPWHDPVRLKEALDASGITLSAIALVLPWNGPEETETEKAEADEVIGLLKQFPDALLCTVQLPTGRHDIATRRHNLVQSINAVSRRAAQQGIRCSFHPNSPHHSITRTQEDYNAILPALDSAATGWTPDTGHIINGGMDPLQTMQQYQPLINHVHYKDWNGHPEFTLMGTGRVDFHAITAWLQSINYNGWIICEDEGPEALKDPDAVTGHDGRWIRETLWPALKK